MLPLQLRHPLPSLTPRPAAPQERSAPKDDRPAAPATSIVRQIDAILQERLAGTPLEDRGVFLAQSPDGGVNVYVGLTRYAGIEDVPDAEIKAAIRAAISEWENKYTPGLSRHFRNKIRPPFRAISSVCNARSTRGNAQLPQPQPSHSGYKVDVSAVAL